MKFDAPATRAMTPVIANILLVAVVVILAVTVAGLSLAFLEDTGTPTAEASFDFEQTSAGLELVPKALGTDVTVKLNGRTVTTVAADSAGQAVLLPTAPGDTVTVVSTDEDRSLLLKEEIDDRSEVGDFIAYYTFDDSDSKNTLEDQSGNANDGTLVNDPTWRGSSLAFEPPKNQYVDVNALDSGVSVDEFTIAVTYQTNDLSRKQELVEHKSGDDNWVLELKPCTHSQVNVCSGADAYTPVYSVDSAGGSQTGQIFGGKQDAGNRQVLVGTYDGSEYTLYVDGQKKNTSRLVVSQSGLEFASGTLN